VGKLDGRVAIVTGAGTGIGRSGARILAAEGVAVVATGPDEEPLHETVRLVQSAGGHAAYTLCDVAVSAQVHAMVDFAVRTFGKLDILYNNAGIVGSGTVEEITEAYWDRVIDVNLKSCFLTAKAAVPVMRANGGGVIINTSSVLGINTYRRQVSYAASKAGVIGLTKALAIDHADDNIRVLAIVPGSTDTAMMWGEGSPERRAEWMDIVRREHVQRRVAQPDEIARVVAFLASDDASFMTGSCVMVEGGGLAKWGGGI
jgi:NAD(P)-dependent dehydrogenase (short-subunit alcohol dehydrogenase family)